MRARLRLALLPALWPAWAGACESCRDTLANDPAAHGFSKGIYFSIIMMLGVVATLVAVFVGFVVREARRGGAADGQSPGT